MFNKIRRASWIVKLALIFLGLMVVVTLFGDLMAPFDHAQTDILNALLPPAIMDGGQASHLLGTDHLGRDILSRLLFSIRITVIIACVGSIVSAILGTILGMVAGEQRGILEASVMMLVDIQMALPFLVFGLTALAILGNSFYILLLVIGISGWESYARLAYSMVLKVMNEEYVMAARAIGVSKRSLYQRTLLPNIISPLIVQFSITLSGTILLESALSFLGLGFQPPITSLGQMLGEGREYLLFAPWLTLSPAIVIFLVILSINIIGDWLRDILDPTS